MHLRRKGWATRAGRPSSLGLRALAVSRRRGSPRGRGSAAGCAVAAVRSNSRPPTYGPRSITRTRTVRPPWRSVTFAPHGSDLCATPRRPADSVPPQPRWLPYRPGPYQDALGVAGRRSGARDGASGRRSARTRAGTLRAPRTRSRSTKRPRGVGRGAVERAPVPRRRTCSDATGRVRAPGACPDRRPDDGAPFAHVQALSFLWLTPQLAGLGSGRDGDRRAGREATERDAQVDRGTDLLV